MAIFCSFAITNKERKFIMMRPDEVRGLLREVPDPMMASDLIAAGRVVKLAVRDTEVNLHLQFPSSLTAEQKSTLIFSCVSKINGKFAEANVHVHVETSQVQKAAKTGPLPQVKHIIAVGSGKGGVGKSTVSVNLTMALKNRGYKVGLLDADLYGPSLPAMLDLQGQRPKVKDVHGRAKILPITVGGIPVMSMGFVVDPEQAVVLRGPRLAGVIKQFMEECLWPELDYLIVDLPPGTGDIQLTLVQTVSVTGALVVTTPQKISVIDALKAANMFRLPSIKVPILGVVENMSWFTPQAHPDEKYLLFGEGGGAQLAHDLNGELLGQIPMVQGIMQGGEDGTPGYLDARVPVIREAFDALAAQLELAVHRRNEQEGPTKPVQIKQ